jgi:hypothetical protein
METGNQEIKQSKKIIPRWKLCKREDHAKEKVGDEAKREDHAKEKVWKDPRGSYHKLIILVGAFTVYEA